MEAYAVEMRNISKHYGSLWANRDINLQVKQGEVHAIVGENGAGKSTLMNILYGLVTPDSGAIFINGREVKIASPRVAIDMGIGMVHQHFKLVPGFTVAENICLGMEPKRGFLIDKEKMLAMTLAMSREFGLDIDPAARIKDLPVGILQRAEILKALGRGARILILDEPTAVLTPGETGELFNTIRKMADQGKTIILITHKLKEVLAISQRVTILRQGRVVGNLVTRETNERELASLMVGKEVSFQAFPRKEVKGTAGEVLRIDKLSVYDSFGVKKVKEVSFGVKPGEIVTIAGVEGNGQTELAEALAGLGEAVEGRIFINDEEITNLQAGKRREKVAYIPEDRIKTGLNIDGSIHDNLIAGIHKRGGIGGRGFIDYRRSTPRVQDLITRFSIKVNNPFQLVRHLSGGNQQKVVVAREFNLDTPVLVVSQPSRGVDIASTRFIHGQLMALRNAGKGILLISTDLDEVFALSDRILVLFEGRITGEFTPSDITREEIGLYMTGARRQVSNNGKAGGRYNS